MLKILNHPLIKIKLTKMRDEKASHTIFRQCLNEIASLMVYEVLRDYKTKPLDVKTPTGSVANGQDFNKEIVIVPILRAGLGMVQGIERLVPQARIGHIGMYREETTFKAVPYFYKMPNVDKASEIIVVDPMLATGVSSNDAISKLKHDGFKKIRLVSLVAAPEGVKRVEEANPDVTIYLAALDDKLDENKYIRPGLGDAGDRLFGTK
ncbi:uracil phosphoribosyltransferase [Candidatus Mycoplasma mahonii]|uniref:uracil phosphoribosyltransferase n=1 Tax=Candidatus Mycoplasma mahonii TaxID=3004105 RepID=UPI0026ED68FE|nr:uracil phosphoribosyltransferase [Candidatus Mycoplasma mahonii]WKX02797.1 uracil phosphoribosyltransferase [Candidatus Mycoplasma mahonii]